MTETDLFVERRAWWSEERPDPVYRYMLDVRWDRGKPLVCVCLNPSTADEVKSDPTVTRLETRARAMGCGALIVLNAFAFRSTDPKAMLAAEDPVGKFNDSYISHVLRDAKALELTVAVGWGQHGHHRGRDQELQAMFDIEGITPMCWKMSPTTRQPHHPLYLPYSLPLIPWTPGF